MSIDTRQRIKAMLILLLFGLFCILLICQMTRSNKTFEQIKPVCELPSLIDIQKMLNEIEPNSPINADGVYGPATKEKWERVWMNQQAKKYIEELK